MADGAEVQPSSDHMLQMTDAALSRLHRPSLADLRLVAEINGLVPFAAQFRHSDRHYHLQLVIHMYDLSTRIRHPQTRDNFVEEFKFRVVEAGGYFLRAESPPLPRKPPAIRTASRARVR
jgi:hypothetical protein